MEIYIERTNKKFQKNVDKIKVIDLLKELNINLEEVLVTKNDELVDENEILENDDKVKIISVISGG
ncbi:MAG: MoaD/ThiS family protein [Candidatus Woesearchaeota archaeon]